MNFEKDDPKLGGYAMLICFVAIPAIIFAPIWSWLQSNLFAEALYALVFGIQVLCVWKFQPFIEHLLRRILEDQETKK